MPKFTVTYDRVDTESVDFRYRMSGEIEAASVEDAEAKVMGWVDEGFRDGIMGSEVDPDVVLVGSECHGETMEIGIPQNVRILDDEGAVVSTPCDSGIPTDGKRAYTVRLVLRVEKPVLVFAASVGEAVRLADDEVRMYLQSDSKLLDVNVDGVAPL